MPGASIASDALPCFSASHTLQQPPVRIPPGRRIVNNSGQADFQQDGPANGESRMVFPAGTGPVRLFSQGVAGDAGKGFEGELKTHRLARAGDFEDDIRLGRGLRDEAVGGGLGQRQADFDALFPLAEPDEV